MTTRRLYIALSSYATLALGAWLALSGDIRLVVWIFIGGLAVKSWIGWKKERMESRKDT